MSAPNANAVELKGVTFKRGERSIFNNVDIVIPRGKVTAIMGPSGCGKTTLLRLIAAQLKPTHGEVWVAGTNLPTLSRRELFDMRKQMGVLFQSGALFTDLDVFENVAFPLRVHTKLPEEMIRDIVLPRARPGIIGATMLGLGRALGETVAVAMLIGGSQRMPSSLFQGGQSMAGVIAITFQEASPENIKALLGVGVVLFVITVIVNMAARLVIWATGGRVAGDAAI